MRRFFFCLSFFLAVFLPLAGQEDFLQFSLSPNPVGVNENFTLSLVIPGVESRDVSIMPGELPRGVQIIRGPLVRPHTYYSQADGSPQTGALVSWTFRSQESGRIPFEGFDINTGEGIISTGPFLMEIGVYRNRRLVIPLEANWAVPSEPVYPGEAVPVILQVGKEREIPLFESLVVRPPATGLWDEQAGLGEIISTVQGGAVFYTIPVASYLFTPTEGRSVVIPQASVSQGERTGQAAQRVLNINPLPPGLEDTGAIGRFELSAFLEGEELYQGSEVTYRLRLTGTGNLNYLRIPHPEFAGARVLSVQEIQEYGATMEGYQGFRELVFIISLQDARELRILVPAFAFFSKTQNQVLTLPGLNRSYPLIEQKTSREEPGSLIDGFVFLTEESNFLYKVDPVKNRWLFLLFLPGPLFFIITRLLTRKKKSRGVLLGSLLFGALFLSSALPERNSGENAYAVCESLFARGDYAGTLTALEELDPRYERQGFHLYNKSLVYFGLGEFSQAIVLAQAAVQLEPMNFRYRDTVKIMEKNAGIINSYPPVLPLDYRVLCFILIIGVNLLGLWGGIYNLKPGSGAVILAILTGTLILAGIGALGCAAVSSRIPRGIVCPSYGEARSLPADSEGEAVQGQADVPRVSTVSLKRIPKETGQDWLPLRHGTMVRIKDKTGDFLLVQDGENIVGWIHKDALLLPDDWK